MALQRMVFEKEFPQFPLKDRDYWCPCQCCWGSLKFTHSLREQENDSVNHEQFEGNRIGSLVAETPKFGEQSPSHMIKCRCL